MRKYIKKPVTVEAFQFFYNDEESTRLLKEEVGTDNCFYNCDGKLFLRTLEGALSVRDGDFIIKGIKGEFYSCREDIFYKTYYADDIVYKYIVHLEKHDVFSPIYFNTFDEAVTWGRELFKKFPDINDYEDFCYLDFPHLVDDTMTEFYISRCKEYVPHVWNDGILHLMQEDLEDSRDCFSIYDFTNDKSEEDLELIVNEAIRGWAFKYNLIDGGCGYSIDYSTTRVVSLEE